MQILYHGSPVGGLTALQPHLSEHGKPYVYFSTNPNVALLYAVKPVPKPYSFYPFGFDTEGNPVYSEYFKDAFSVLYKGKTGYLYECSGLEKLENPTHISSAYTTESPVPVERVTEIPDLYTYFKKQEEQRRFTVKTFSQIGEKELRFARKAVRKEMEMYGLRNAPENPMSVFIRTYFPKVWED